MDEFALIERFFATRAVSREDVCIGIGDDAAVTRLDEDAELVIATDMLVEGTHFPVGTSAHALGHRCLAVNLSDLAAMGAEPLWCTLALSLPEGSADWVERFSSGFMALANEHAVALVGGDTVRGPLSMTVTVHGRVAPGAAIRRSGAGPDEGIYITGQTGRAAAGLALLLDGIEAGEADHPELVECFLYPVARVREGMESAAWASSMIDISDGLHVDLARLLRASGVGATLNLEAVSVAAAAVEHFGHRQALQFALTGGDDYELCFTVSADREVEMRALARAWECGITCIGRTHAETGITWMERGRVQSIDDTSFRHFVEESE